jgi:hypothetical protein
MLRLVGNAKIGVSHESVVDVALVYKLKSITWWIFSLPNNAANLDWRWYECNLGIVCTCKHLEMERPYKTYNGQNGCVHLYAR